MNGEIGFYKIILVATGINFIFIAGVYASEGLWQDNGVTICNAAGAQLSPQVIPDYSGGAIITWIDLRNGHDDIYCQHVNSAGIPQWDVNGVVICNAAGSRSCSKLISWYGGAIFAWADARNGYYNIYSQCIYSSGTPKWDINGIAICNATGNQANPQLIFDNAGGAILVWVDTRNNSLDIYSQRVNSSGISQWSTNGVSICNAANDQASPQLFPDGSGGAIIAWCDRRGGDWDIYCQHINSFGVSQWTANGIAICRTAGDQISPQLIADGAGGAIITWQDGRNGNGDIYCQRISSSGVPQWDADGIAVCNATGDQISPQLIADGAGEAIITWQDGRNGNGDIYCQRISSSGAPQGDANGIVICNAANDQVSPQLIPDGTGGAIISWVDTSRGNYNYDVYSQRINNSGISQWSSNGVLICKAVDSPQLISDGANGAIIAWNNLDIFCQRMIRPHPQPLTINSPAASGLLFRAAITGNWFTDDRGSVVAAKLTRTASADIPFSVGTLNVTDANHLTCDFDLSSASPGDWSLVLTDSLSQSSSGAVTLTISTSTPTFTVTPTTTQTPTSIITPTTTPTPTTTSTALPTSTPIPGTQTIVVDHYIYVTAPNGGLNIYDNSAPNHPQTVYSVPGNWRIYIKGNVLYRVDCHGTLYADDIHNPSHPRELFQRQTGGDAVGIDGFGNYVLVADGQNGVAIFDVSVASDICLKDRVTTPGNARDVQVVASEKRAYVVWPDGNEWSFDLSNYYLSPTLSDDGGYASPNPFLPVRGQKVFFNFHFTNPSTAYTIHIYNLRGQLQRTLTATREWDGRSEAGHLCEGGVYVYQIEAEGKRVSGKVVLIK